VHRLAYWSLNVLFFPRCLLDRYGSDSGCYSLPSAQSDGNLMPVALIFQVDDEGRARPKIRCDECSQIIEDPSGGIAIWDRERAKPGAVVEPSFQCQGCKSKAGGAPPNSVPLDHFMLYLLNNLQLSPGVLEEAGRRLRETAR
jgi:hypothetical protein